MHELILGDPYANFDNTTAINWSWCYFVNVECHNKFLCFVFVMYCIAPEEADKCILFSQVTAALFFTFSL